MFRLLSGNGVAHLPGMIYAVISRYLKGVVGGANVLGKLLVPGCPTYLDNSKARAYCACSRCGRGWFGHFFSYLSFLSFFSHSLGDGPI